MRKSLAVAVLGVWASAGAAFAGDPDVGCGWGTKAFKGKTGIAPKVMAATTNACSGSQTFGISSGTAGCTQGGVVRADARLNMYAAANLDTLARDMAVGRGESLATLAHLMGVSRADAPAFNRLAKSNFGLLFPSDETTAGDVLATLVRLMASDPVLARYVA